MNAALSDHHFLYMDLYGHDCEWGRDYDGDCNQARRVTDLGGGDPEDGEWHQAVRRWRPTGGPVARGRAADRDGSDGRPGRCTSPSPCPATLGPEPTDHNAEFGPRRNSLSVAAAPSLACLYRVSAQTERPVARVAARADRHRGRSHPHVWASPNVLPPRQPFSHTAETQVK